MFSSFSTTMAMVLFCIGAATSLQLPSSSWAKMQEAALNPKHSDVASNNQKQQGNLLDENQKFMKDLFSTVKTKESTFNDVAQLAQAGTDDDDDLWHGDLTGREIREGIREGARAFANLIGDFVGDVFLGALLGWTGRSDEIIAAHPEFVRMQYALAQGLSTFLFAIFHLPMFIIFAVFGFLGLGLSLPARIFW